MYLRHAVWMPPHRLSHESVKWKPTGVRKWGHPRKTIKIFRREGRTVELNPIEKMEAAASDREGRKNQFPPCVSTLAGKGYNNNNCCNSCKLDIYIHTALQRRLTGYLHMQISDVWVEQTACYMISSANRLTQNPNHPRSLITELGRHPHFLSDSSRIPMVWII